MFYRSNCNLPQQYAMLRDTDPYVTMWPRQNRQHATTYQSKRSMTALNKLKQYNALRAKYQSERQTIAAINKRKAEEKVSLTLPG